MKPVLISGIQPTGRLHIGNYLGALKNFVDLQNRPAQAGSGSEYQCYFFIADLHALTETHDPKDLHENILSLTADFLAAGLDPEKSTIFQQSQSPSHTELTWILGTFVSMANLAGMTQLKDRANLEGRNRLHDKTLESFMRQFGHKPETAEEEEAIKASVDQLVQMENALLPLFQANAGLATYPVLMAADILLYDAESVPVGNDQDQHLELARTLAHKFNTKFGKTFVEPQGLHTKTPRVMSLDDPTKKMSKSLPTGCLFLDDSPEEIKKKISRAVTDSGSKIEYEPEKKPGISNLLEIYGAFSHMEPKLVAEEFAGQNYSHFKSRLGELVADYFADFREKKKRLVTNNRELMTVLKSGSEKADAVAEKKIEEVKRKIGILV